MKTYPGHELSIPQLLHALPTKLDCGELTEETKSDLRNSCVPLLEKHFLVYPCALGYRYYLSGSRSDHCIFGKVGRSTSQRLHHALFSVVYKPRDVLSDIGSAFTSIRGHEPARKPPECGRFPAIMKNPLPRLTRLELDILDRKAVEGPHPFPPLKSLTLGNTTHLQHFQPSNLRKLGVGCDERGFQLPLLELPLLEFLARVPLLEELEFKVAHFYKFEEVREDMPSVVLKHLQRVVFRGTRPEFIHSLTSNIIHPRHTKIVLVCYIPDHDFYASYYMFPRGMRLPIPTPPKYIRYQVVHDEDCSESNARIDLISIDGRHALIENRCAWPDDDSPGAEYWTKEWLDDPCLEFLQTLDLSFVEKLCFELCPPYNFYVLRKLMGAMDKLETLVVVNGDPSTVFMAMKIQDPPNVICPLMRRLVVRCDLDISIPWGEIVELVETRATHGSPLEWVTLISSFSELLEEPAKSVELLEGVTEVRYDLGRSTVGWEWWKE